MIDSQRNRKLKVRPMSNASRSRLVSGIRNDPPAGRIAPKVGIFAIGMEELKRYEDILMAKRRDLSGLRAEDGSLVPPASATDGDAMDMARADVEAEIQADLRQRNSQLLMVIEDALTRIRDGRFGICMGCDEPIAKPRLEAVPWTDLCRGCKEIEDMSPIR
jgi:DnaK suppressor protein